MRFEVRLRRHLDAIRRRDLGAFAATLHPSDVVLISADGEVVTDRDEILRRHAEWFAMDGWAIDTELLHVREEGDVATCVLLLDHRDAAAVERSILSLMFRRDGDRWLMVQDQNTPKR